jgi:hypothetical protein
MSRLVTATPAQDDADHIPPIVDTNTRVPSRVAAPIEGGGTDPAPVLAATAKRPGEAGAGALAMLCNTAHHHAPGRSARRRPFRSGTWWRCRPRRPAWCTDQGCGHTDPDLVWGQAVRT